MIVVAIIGILAAASWSALGQALVQNRVKTAALSFSATFQMARQRAAMKGRDVILVMIQSTGTNGADADQCGGLSTDSTCTRWWMLEDVGTQFNDTALTNFHPATPTDQGDVLAEFDVFPRRVRFGVGAGFTSIAPPAPFATLPDPTTAYPGSIKGCSMCDTTNAPAPDGPRGYVRFSPNGVVSMGKTPAVTPAPVGGVVFLTDGLSSDTAGFGVTVPSGIITNRFWVQR